MENENCSISRHFFSFCIKIVRRRSRHFLKLKHLLKTVKLIFVCVPYVIVLSFQQGRLRFIFIGFDGNSPETVQ